MNDREPARKKERVLDIFYRAMKGESISVKELADEYQVTPKTISRDINEIKNFLSDHRELVGNAELKYEAGVKSYYLELDHFLLSKELAAMIKMMIGCRAFSKMEILEMITKLKSFTSHKDRSVIEGLIAKEMYHYNQVNHDCNSVIDQMWKLTRCINRQIEITITYYKMDRELVERKVKPIAIMFSDFYYYLIAYRSDREDWEPIYFRVDRITSIVEHRSRFQLDRAHSFDEGELREKIQFMFPVKCRRIKFEFTGPSIQAVLDKIPTAKVIEVRGKAKVVEAEVYGRGVNMYLLSQGSWVKVLGPEEFVDEMRAEIERMGRLYDEEK